MKHYPPPIAGQAIVGRTDDMKAIAGLAHLKYEHWICYATEMFNHKNYNS